MDNINGDKMTADRKLEFRQFYEQQYNAVVGVIYARLGSKEQAEDTTQDAFIRAFEAWGRFNPDLGGNGKPWIMKIAINLSNNNAHGTPLRNRRNVLLSSKIGGESDGTYGDIIKDESEGIEDRLLRLERAERLRGALGKLPPDRQDLIRMRYFEGIPFRDIAKLTGIPPKTLRVQVHRTLKVLRRHLPEDAA